MPKNKGNLVSSPIRPLTTGMTIPVAYSNELLGGLHSVDNISDRNVITTDRRQFGMLVYIINTNEFYQLKQINSTDVSDNLNWDLINISGVPTTTEWLDSVISRTGTPPLLPNLGDRYLVTIGTSVWTGFDDLIVEWDGTSWDITIPSEGTTLRVDDESNGLYSFIQNQWTFYSFSFEPFTLRNDIPLGLTLSVSTGSQYLIYGDLNIDGSLESWGNVSILNGQITGSGTYSISGSGSFQSIELLTEIQSGTGISVTTGSFSERIVSTNLISGTGISFSYGPGTAIEISSVFPTFPGGRPKYVIENFETISVPDYELYYIYGDLEVQGTLDISTFGKVVVTNGNLIAASGSTISNIGNVEIYDLLTVADDNIKIDISEIKYGKEGRILFESELKYIPLIGATARVVTESDDLVYSTSSAYVTSTLSTAFDRYLGISTDDPQKKLHINGSGILIDGIESEQDETLGDPNWARFVIDTSTSNTNTLMDLRNDQGRVLWVDGDITGGFRYPSVSIGRTASGTIFNVSDYYGNDYLAVGATGAIIIASMSEFNWIGLSTTGFDKVIVRDDLTGELKYRAIGWEQDCVSYEYQKDSDRMLGIGITAPSIDAKVHILTTGQLASSASYVSAGLKVDVIGASAVSNNVYSGDFSGGIGLRTDDMLITGSISVGTFSNDNSLGKFIVWDDSTQLLKYSIGFGGVQAQGQPANLNKTAHGLNTGRLCDGSTQIMNEIYDDDNSYNNATGIWTCPTNGRYDLSFFVTYMKNSGDGFFSSGFEGSFKAGITSPTGCNYYCANSFTLNNISKHVSISGQALGLQLTAGTQLCLKVINLSDFNYTSTSGDVVRMSIRRVR